MVLSKVYSHVLGPIEFLLKREGESALHKTHPKDW